MEIRNKEYIIDQLTYMLYKLECACLKNDTQIYLGVDEAGNGNLETHESIGNSYIVGDNLYYLDTIKGDSNDCVDYMCPEGTDDLCEILNVKYEDLLREVRNHYDMDPDSTIEFCQLACYVRENEKYLKIVQDAYEDWLMDYYYEYQKRAEKIFGAKLVQNGCKITSED